MLVALLAHLGITSAQFARKTVRIGSGLDAFLGGRLDGVVNDAMDEFRRRLGPDQTLAVLPEGVMIDYLVRRPSSTPYTVFMPLEMAVFGEEKILASFESNPPDYVALVHKDTSEYGYRFFGRDYGRKLFRWISENYREELLIGAPPLQDRQFWIRLLRRSPTP